MKFRKLVCIVFVGAVVFGFAVCGNFGGSKDAVKLGGDGVKIEIIWWVFLVFI